MKFSDIKSMSRPELEKELISIQRSTFNLKMLKATAGLKQVHQFKNNRRDIARIKTLLTMMKKENINE
jgi:large subunit ribosomal protein L29